MRGAASLFLLLYGILAYSQNVTIEDYVKQGLESNLILEDKSFDIDIATIAISQAKSKLFPQLQMLGRYSIASGGRQFTIPTGTLFNPINRNLNEINNTLTTISAQYPQQPTYIQLEDEAVKFLREREYEVMLRLEWPILNDLLRQNIKKHSIKADVAMVKVKAYKNLLSKEIKQAYFQHIVNVEMLKVLNEQQKSLDLGKEILKAQYKAGKVSPIDLDQIELNELTHEYLLAEAKRDSIASHIFFNFLLNRERSEMIIVDTMVQEIVSFESFDEMLADAQDRNLENQILDMNMDIIRLDQSTLKNEITPKLALIGDLGLQGVDLGFTNENRFAQLSLQLRWNIVDFSRSKRAQINTLNVLKNKSKRALNNNQIESDLLLAYENLNVSKTLFQLNEKKVNQAVKIYRLDTARFQKGLISLIDWEGSRTQLLQLELELNRSKYKYVQDQIYMEWLIGKTKNADL